VDVRLSSVALQQRIPSVNPFTQKVVDVAAVDLESKTKTAVGFNLGILAKPSEEWSVGIAYRHKVKIEYTGTAAFNLLDTGSSELDTLVARTLPSSPVPVTTSIEFPAILSGGVAYTRDDWVIEADVNWYQWSTFASLPVDLEGRPDLSRVVPESYKNSMQYRIGVERRLTEYFLIRGGYFFDRTPSPPESMSPLLPDADRHGFALGTTWTSGRFRLDAAAWYVRSPDRATEGLSRDRYDGTYKSSSATLGISLGYSF
jgi:long-chain fatty acid transport protein